MSDKKQPDQKAIAGSFGAAAAEIARNFASFAAKKTKNVSRIARLNVEIVEERDTIKRVYLEIGKLYYEMHRSEPESCFEQLCKEIDVSMESIASMEAEIARLKEQDPREDESAEADPPGEGS